MNKLIVTCVRSGQSKPFRVLQKPERAAMRALRTSPSGRYPILLYRCSLLMSTLVLQFRPVLHRSGLLSGNAFSSLSDCDILDFCFENCWELGDCHPSLWENSSLP